MEGKQDERSKHLWMDARGGGGNGPAGIAVCRTNVHPPPPRLLEAQSAPAAPTGLAAAAGDHSVTLTWNNPGDSSITGYEYQVNHNDTSTGRLSGWSGWAGIPNSGSSTTSHAFTGLANGREYRYQLRAVNANGDGPGAPNASPWYVSASPAAPPTQAPDTPGSVTITRADGSLTASWDPTHGADRYHVTYSSDHRQSWNAAASPGDNHSANRVVINADNAKTHHVAVRAGNGAGWSGWRNSPASPPFVVPPPPTNLRVERVCDHRMRFRWHHAPGATGYDVNLSANHRKSWKRVLTNGYFNGWQATWWQKNKTYYFAIRSVNAAGTSAWVNSAAAPAPPCAVANLRVTTSADPGEAGDTVTASWDAGQRASAYHVDYAGARLVSNLAATSHTWGVSSRGASDTVSVRSVSGNITGPSRSANVAWLTPSSIVGTDVTLNLAGHAGDWHVKKTAPTPAGDCVSAGSGTTHDLSGLTVNTTHTFTAYADAACAHAMATTTFTTGAGLSVTNIKATSATLNIAGHSGQWWYNADTGPDTTCQGPVAAGTSSDNLTGLTEHQQYTYTAYDAAGCNAADALDSITFEPSGDVLTAENVTATTATLKLENHTGDWWYKRTAPDAGSCTAGEADFTNDLTGLIPVTTYTYKSYDVDTCGDTHEGDSVTFTTAGVSVSNLGKQAGIGSALFVGVNSGYKQESANSFRTGNSSNGYILHSVAAKFTGASGSPSNLTFSLHAPDTNDASKPADSAIANATFSGGNPSLSGISTVSHTCSGVGCQLTASTDYFIVANTTATAGSNYYYWDTVAETSETKVPSNNGWSIGNNGLNQISTTGWFVNSEPLAVKVVATVNPLTTLTASGISGTGATLTIANRSGTWYYQGISGTSAASTCETVIGNTKSLSSLTANNLYGYTAYSGANCASGTELATEYFSTTNFDVGNLGEAAASGFRCTIGFLSDAKQCAVAFTTGSRSGGYTLKSVAGRFGVKDGNPGSIVVAIHAADTANSANPAATAKVTLSGSDPDAAGLHTFTCAGSDCALSASATYFVVMSTGDTSGISAKYYKWQSTDSDAETGHPSTHGWTIANAGRYKSGSNAWTDLAAGRTGQLHVAADE